MNNNFSIILLTKNEAKHLSTWKTWLSQLHHLNEIIIVDDNSTDDTLKVAKSLKTSTITIKSFTRSLNGNFSAQRQFAVDQSSNNFILWLDPDEKPSNNLIEYINHIDTSQFKAFAFKRLDYFLNRPLKHGENYSQYFVRFFDKREGKFVHKVHEVWSTSNLVKHLDLDVIHQPFPTLTHFFSKLNFYSDIRAQELFDQKVSVNIFHILFYPFAKFIKDYIFLLGFLDGTPGIIMALGMSFHSFLVRGKLWTLYRK